MVKSNEHGVTIIELLTAITILAIVGAIIWGAYSQGMNFSKNEITKNEMQQEANIIISQLTRIHQTTQSYRIVSSECTISVTYTEKNKPDVNQTTTFENSKLCLRAEENLDKDNNNTNQITEHVLIKGNPEFRDTPLSIMVIDKNNSNNYLQFETLLYRLKGGG